MPKLLSRNGGRHGQSFYVSGVDHHLTFAWEGITNSVGFVRTRSCYLTLGSVYLKDLANPAVDAPSLDPHPTSSLNIALQGVLANHNVSLGLLPSEPRDAKMTSHEPKPMIPNSVFAAFPFPWGGEQDGLHQEGKGLTQAPKHELET